MIFREFVELADNSRAKFTTDWSDWSVCYHSLVIQIFYSRLYNQSDEKDNRTLPIKIE